MAPPFKKLSPLSPEARALAAQWHPLAYRLAKEVALSTGLDRGDLLGEAYLELCRLATYYDPDRGVSFGPFAKRFIRGHLWGLVRRLRARPRNVGLAEALAESRPEPGGDIDDLLAAASGLLTDARLEALRLRFGEGLTIVEAAGRLGVSPKALAARASAAYEILRNDGGFARAAGREDAR